MRDDERSQVRIAVVGAGAFGVKHLEVLSRIEGVDVAAVASRTLQQARDVAARFDVDVATDSFADVIAMSDVDAVILCSPTPLHAEQAEVALRRGKHVQIEIPLADNWTSVQHVSRVARDVGLVCMVGHTRRFNPPHQWVHQRIVRGELSLLHLQAETFFHRRRNVNALGQPRSWTDNLLWHHAAHTVDLFAHQSRGAIVEARVMAGPTHPDLRIPMDMSIQLRSESGSLCTLALSFNHAGPLGTTFRYICDDGTYVASYDQLLDGDGVEIKACTSGARDGVELQDREFVNAIEQGRTPESSIDSVIDCYRTLGMLQLQLDQQRLA